MASESRLICISYLAPHESHLMLPMLWSKSIVQPQRSLPPQKGQSNTCDTFGFAFWGGGLARFRLPLRQRCGRGQGLESAAVCRRASVRARRRTSRKLGWGAIEPGRFAIRDGGLIREGGRTFNLHKAHIQFNRMPSLAAAITNNEG